MKNKQKGFTLIEILLGVTVSSLIFLTAGSVFALLFRSDAKTEKLSLMAQVKNDLQIEFSNSIRWATQIDFINGASPEITVDATRYNLQDGRIYKNSEPITPRELSIKKLTINNNSNSSELKSLEITAEVENKNFPSSQDVIKIVVSQRKTIY